MSISRFLRDKLEDILQEAENKKNFSSLAYPEIVPDPRYSDEFTRRFSFGFERKSLEIEVKIQESLYFGAKNTPRKIMIFTPLILTPFIGDKRLTDKERHHLFRVMVTDKAQFPFLLDLFSRFMSLKHELSLDRDRFCELMVSFVQNIPYKTEMLGTKYQVESIGDGYGDCDDKSLLLASLLYIGGYSVALFYYEKESHMAVGIGSDDGGFLNSGFAYTETTTPHLIGIIPHLLEGNIPLASHPEIIVIKGDGSRYGKCNEVRYLESCKARVEARIDQCTAEMEPLEKFIDSRRTKILTEHDHLEIQRAVHSYNTLVNEKNRGCQVLDNFTNNQNDRQGLYRYFREKLQFSP